MERHSSNCVLIDKELLDSNNMFKENFNDNNTLFNCFTEIKLVNYKLQVKSYYDDRILEITYGNDFENKENYVRLTAPGVPAITENIVSGFTLYVKKIFYENGEGFEPEDWTKIPQCQITEFFDNLFEIVKISHSGNEALEKIRNKYIPGHFIPAGYPGSGRRRQRRINKPITPPQSFCGCKLF